MEENQNTQFDSLIAAINGAIEASFDKFLVDMASVFDKTSAQIEDARIRLEKYSSTIDPDHQRESSISASTQWDDELETPAGSTIGDSMFRGPDPVDCIEMGGRTPIVDDVMLDLPLFSGENPVDWVRDLEEVFNLNSIPVSQRLALVKPCWEGNETVIRWYKILTETPGYVDWKEFCDMAVYRFGSEDEADELEARREAEASHAKKQDDIKSVSTRIDPPISGENPLICDPILRGPAPLGNTGKSATITGEKFDVYLDGDAIKFGRCPVTGDDRGGTEADNNHKQATFSFRRDTTAEDGGAVISAPRRPMFRDDNSRAEPRVFSKEELELNLVKLTQGANGITNGEKLARSSVVLKDSPTMLIMFGEYPLGKVDLYYLDKHGIHGLSVLNCDDYLFVNQPDMCVESVRELVHVTCYDPGISILLHRGSVRVGYIEETNVGSMIIDEDVCKLDAKNLGTGNGVKLYGFSASLCALIERFEVYDESGKISESMWCFDSEIVGNGFRSLQSHVCVHENEFRICYSRVLLYGDLFVLRVFVELGNTNRQWRSDVFRLVYFGDTAFHATSGFTSALRAGNDCNM